MTARNQHQPGEPQPPEAQAQTPTTRVKKAFVEPAISSPVDVLEATTFFQAVESGGTNRKRSVGPPTD
jgi:hypothetical protein